MYTHNQSLMAIFRQISTWMIVVILGSAALPLALADTGCDGARGCAPLMAGAMQVGSAKSPAACTMSCCRNRATSHRTCCSRGTSKTLSLGGSQRSLSNSGCHCRLRPIHNDRPPVVRMRLLQSPVAILVQAVDSTPVCPLVMSHETGTRGPPSVYLLSCSSLRAPPLS